MDEASALAARRRGAVAAAALVLLVVALLLAAPWWWPAAAAVVPVPVALAAATLASEDLACLTAGELVRRGVVGPATAIAACMVGIYFGDLGLYLLGRLARRAGHRWAWSRRVLGSQRVTTLGERYRRHTGKVILAARFLPGTRAALYLAAGALGGAAGPFLLWSLLAVLLWTPLVVLGAAAAGDAMATLLHRWGGAGTAVTVLVLLLGWLVLRVGPRCATPRGRAQLAAHVARLWRYEFWPAWLFYLPLTPWLAALALRYGPTTFTAANPGIPHGGFVGESKFAILRALQSPTVLPAILVPPHPDPAERAALLARQMHDAGLAFPVVLKPDAGQRGSGVRLVRDATDAHRVLRELPQHLVAQAFHPGPHEAGIFYYRFPDQPTGRIFSITDKQFPVVTGDGVATLEELIWRHPRYRMQAATFLRRHAGRLGTVPAAGATLQLALAGNHCQGTLFRDGAHLLTPALERAIDDAARSFPGFHIGRFDVRYRSVAELMEGRGFAIVEVNGVTSESTNIYDPDGALLWAYGVLARQWLLLYRIGAANRARGVPASSPSALWRDIRAYLREPGPPALAD